MSELNLTSHLEIANLIAALAIHVDALRWDELLLLFAPEVRVDYTSLFGGDAQTLRAEELIGQWQQLLPGFTRTTHVIGTPLIVANGDEARASAPVIAVHLLEDSLGVQDQWIAGGCYEFQSRRTNGPWRIASLTLARAWSRGNLELPALARRRVSEAQSRLRP